MRYGRKKKKEQKDGKESPGNQGESEAVEIAPDKEEEEKRGDGADTPKEGVGGETEEVRDEKEEMIKRLEGEKQELQDEYLRLQAEFQNYSKRIRREFEEKEKFWEAGFIRDLIPGFDNIYRARSSLKDTENAEVKGILMILDSLIGTIKSRGLDIIDPVGKKFDPAYHEAIGCESVPGQEEDTCVRVMDPGYVFKGRVMRPARVIVNKPVEEETEESAVGEPEKE